MQAPKICVHDSIYIGYLGEKGRVECPFFKKFIEFIEIFFFRIFLKMALIFSKNSRNCTIFYKYRFQNWPF
jgi:hypothetical protein